MSGSPEPSIAWFQHDDKIPLKNTTVIVITQSGLTSQLTIVNVTLGDQGTFKCSATSNIGTDSKQAELFVKSKFFFYIVPYMFSSVKLKSWEKCSNGINMIQHLKDVLCDAR